MLVPLLGLLLKLFLLKLNLRGPIVGFGESQLKVSSSFRELNNLLFKWRLPYQILSYVPGFLEIRQSS